MLNIRLGLYNFVLNDCYHSVGVDIQVAQKVDINRLYGLLEIGDIKPN